MEKSSGSHLAPIMFVDTSYLSFYRFFATKRWLKFSQPDLDTKNIEWDKCEPFMQKYESMYLKSLQKFIKKFNVPYQNIVFAKDCKRCDIWRNDLYPLYKGTREESNKTFTGGLVFKHTHVKILPEIEDKYDCKMMKIDRAEADDIIAVCKTHIRAKTPDRKVIIITSDTDYVQLLDEHTEIFSLNNSSLRKKSSGNRDLDVFIKTIRGDKSDNIPSCFKRIGEKTASKYFHNRELLLKQFEKSPGSKDQHELNCKLIDFHNIPEFITSKILALYMSIEKGLIDE